MNQSSSLITADWRDQILKEFTPQVARLTLVADPDGLLTEELVIQGLRERGFELIRFEDPVAFRYAYESKYRSRWDRGELTELVVVLRAEAQELSSLPYDLLQAGRKLSFSLGGLFPNLSYPVIEALDRTDLDAVYRAQLQYKPEKLSDTATKDFLLLHVFEIAPELIKGPSDLLNILLRRHFKGQRIPSLLDDRFIQGLRQNDLFEDWPLEEIVPDRNTFFIFLQERWPAFLERLATGNKKGLNDGLSLYGFELSGPFELPFEHDDVRVYMDNLFFEGLLEPVAHPHADMLSRSWVSVGLKLDPESDRLRRFKGLMESIGSSLPSPDARHQEWLTFARKWAELIVLRWEVDKTSSPELLERVQSLQNKVDERFFSWMQQRFAGLHNQPPIPPAMVHHIPRAIARVLAKSQQERIALVVIDGLSVDQWVVLRDVLSEKQQAFQFHEDAVFCWIPTTTSVSRQAIFAGKAPLYFPGSIHTTEKESALWIQFWLDHGLAQHEIAYKKGLANGNLDELKETLEQPQLRIIGLVVDKVDKIMHGMELGTAGMHNQVRQWALGGYVSKLLDILQGHSFRVWITSDHGNIEAEGCGRPEEGAIADIKGERVRVYSNSLLRSKVQMRFPDAIAWPSIGLPEDYLPLLAKGRTAFIPEGKRTVAHGGITIEEAIVPLIQVVARDRRQSDNRQRSEP